jgi:DNA repair protein SbcC/Rad50
MRPIKLTLQAFGPFAERQEIDFRSSLDQRLFGFYGETGGGKTSILDGRRRIYRPCVPRD